MTQEELLVGQVRALRDRMADEDRVVLNANDLWEDAEGNDLTMGWHALNTVATGEVEEPDRACLIGHVYLIQHDAGDGSELAQLVGGAMFEERLHAGNPVSTATQALRVLGREGVVERLDAWLAEHA
jgi:hypothetical protein